MQTLTFRPISYESDPLADQAAQLVFKEVLGSRDQPEDAAAIYSTMVGAMDNFCVIDDTDKLAAVGSLKIESDHIGAVENVAVDDSFRGRKVGSFLLDQLEGQARQQGLELLTVTALSSAIGFYERHGYRPITPAQPENLAKHL